MEVPVALVATVAQEACLAAMEEDHQANKEVKQANKDQKETSKAKPWDYSETLLVAMMKKEEMVAKKVFAAVEFMAVNSHSAHLNGVKNTRARNSAACKMPKT